LVLKTKEQAKANLEASIAYIPARYTAGVQQADWATPAGSDQAEANYAAAVQNAASKKSRQKGVQAVSNEEWKNNCVNKGAGIIGERLRGALGKWERKWGPMYDTVKSTVGGLPPKTTDFRANINARLVPTVEAWKRAAGKL
jgi:hypothetical protein